VLLAVAFALSIGAVPHTELPARFVGGRVFAMPRVANSDRRLALWVDSDGSGFLRSGIVSKLGLQTTAAGMAYLPKLDERAFPPVTGNHGALPILDDAQVASDPIFAGIDGQLGWSWLDDRIWTIDYTGHHLYQDYSAPPFPDAARVPLVFDSKHRYPQVDLLIDGKSYRAALDTAASIALSQRTMQELGDALPPVRATSFVPHRTLDAWHAAHPEWTYIADAGIAKGVSMIRVPEVRAARVVFRSVWFSTRPDDDVFEGEGVDLKLGPSAFGNCAVTIDYVNESAGFECST
jgi:hypothetical protein